MRIARLRRGLSGVVIAATLLPVASIPRTLVWASTGLQDTQGCVLNADQERVFLSASYQDFDQGMGAASWRSLLNRGCPVSASAVIAKYITAHRSSLALEELRLLHFHQGQTLALAGRRKEAITPLREALSGEPTREWLAYVEATIAFLDSDRAALRAARDRYAALSAAASARLRVIDGLIACFERPYAEAWMCPAKENSLWERHE